MLPALLGLLSPVVGKVLDKIPDAGARDKARQEFELAMAEKETEILKLMLASDSAQSDINKIDAGSENWFQRNWRPALCWVGVFGVSWFYVLQPIFVYLFPLRPLPAIGAEGLMELMLLLLGFGGMRQFQKYKGIK